jgi:DNA-binding transcriptional LysR family regulator
VLRRYRDSDWIVNSRNDSDLDALRRLASQAGFVPRVVHRADSLELVEDLIVAGLGVGLLPEARPPAEGVRFLPLREPRVALRAYAVARRGRTAWPPLALVLRLLSAR